MTTSEVQLTGVAMPVIRVRAPSTTTSTKSASHASRTAEARAWRVHAATVSVHSA